MWRLAETLAMPHQRSHSSQIIPLNDARAIATSIVLPMYLLVRTTVAFIELPV